MSFQPKTLRVLRAQYGYPQKVMADKLGISVSQYSKIETGDKPLHVELLIKLSEIFRLSPWQLLEEIIAHNGSTASSYFQGKAAAEARRSAHDPEKDGEELAYYKTLAAHYEKKYMALYGKFVERSQLNDPEDI